MAVVRDNNKWNADLLTDLQALGSDDGVTSDVVAWAVDQNNWYYPNVINAGTSTWTALATGGATTLQEAYDGGNTIVTDSTGGDFDVSGTEAVSLDASAASNFTVAGANLTLSTTTSGNVVATSAGLLDLNAGANLDVDVTGTMDFLSTGAFSVDGTGASNVTAASGNLTLSTTTSGNVVLTPAGSLILDYGTWPAADGTSGQVLSTNGAGTLSWEDAGAGGGGAVSGVTQTFDNRGAATTTGSATGSGGTVDFTLAVGAGYGEIKFLRVTTASGTCADATIQFFQDSSRTEEVYDAENKDTSVGDGWVDRNPSTMMADDGTDLESNTLYGRITNNDAGSATFDVELVFWADESSTGIGPLLYTTGAVKTGAYTATAGEHVRYDTSGGTFTISMPASPSADQRVGVVETAGDTTTLTVSGNGNNIVDPTTVSVTTSATLTTAYTSVVWKWDDTSSVWRIE